MTLARRTGSWATLAMLLAPGLASAGWDNVFQLTCCGTPRTAAKPCCPPPPCAPQTAYYMQRSYYQPVTAYKPVVSYDPVVSYRTSYYYEPVQSMSYSMYVDPCTGCASQVATPTTSYQLRSQCNAVTNYVQRISYQPVVAYRQSFYYDPVVINPCNTCGPSVAAAPILAAPPASVSPPTTTEQTIPPQGQAPPLNYGPDNRSMPNTSDRAVFPPTSGPSRPLPANFRPDRLASRDSTVQGTIVKTDGRAQAGARIRFVGAGGQQIQPVTADAAGRFRITLTSGSWKVYTEDASGRPAYHSDVIIRGNQDRNVMVVSR